MEYDIKKLRVREKEISKVVNRYMWMRFKRFIKIITGIRYIKRCG
jgi:hypothetical protein